MESERFFRMRACAVIVRDDQILLIDCDEPGYGPHYNLPGGGTHWGEPIREAVRREVREETTLEVEVGPFLMAYEALHEDAAAPAEEHHSFGLLFECHPLPGSEPRLPDVPEGFQIGVVWVPLDDLKTIHLLPDIGPALFAFLRGNPGLDRLVRHNYVPHGRKQ